jgi:hypothetical protein
MTSKPQMVAHYELPGNGYGIQSSGDWVFVAVSHLGLSVLRMEDVEKPIVSITFPTASNSYSTESSILTLQGTASDDRAISRVIWDNDQGGGGEATGTTTWQASNIPLVQGLNNITVTVEDEKGNLGTDVLSVYMSLPDTTPPTLAITSPTPDSTIRTEYEVITLSGSANDNHTIDHIEWVSSKGNSGIAPLNGQIWNIEDIPLNEGATTITVTAIDITGNYTSDEVTILRIAPDITAPTITITFPVNTTEFSTKDPTLNISGEAYDNTTLKQISWTNNSTGESGIATGKALWAANAIYLDTGLNSITVTAEDLSGNTASDNLAVTYSPYDADSDGISDAWELLYFGNLTDAQASTDCGASGIPDLMKFALGMPPWTAPQHLLPQSSLDTDAQHTYLIYKYRRLLAPEYLYYQIGISQDLAHWDYSEHNVEQVGLPVPTGDGITEEATIRVPVINGDNTKVFIQLRVSVAP